MTENTTQPLSNDVTPQEDVEIEYEEKTYKGYYKVNGKLITVNYLGDEETTDLRAFTLPAESLAKLLLREIVVKRKIFPIL
ncbi:MAG TPA: hypothetical protein V6D15_17045 [Oculatellaceae cyanobacterium]|jgi:hypothetical protein